MKLNYKYTTCNHNAVDHIARKAKGSLKACRGPTKYPDELIKEIRDRYETGRVSMKALADEYSEKYGMHHNYVCKILRYEVRAKLFR